MTALRTAESGRGEAGTTLVEVLIAVAILGIAVVGIVGGMATSVIGSDVHRKQAQAQTVLLSAADAVKASGYTPCATTATYLPALGTVTVPSGWESAVSIQAVEVWNGTSFVGGACSSDQKLQRITIQVASPDGRATESVDVVKRNPA